MYLTVTFTRLPQLSQVVGALTEGFYTPREFAPSRELIVQAGLRNFDRVTAHIGTY